MAVVNTPLYALVFMKSLCSVLCISLASSQFLSLCSLIVLARLEDATISSTRMSKQPVAVKDNDVRLDTSTGPQDLMRGVGSDEGVDRYVQGRVNECKAFLCQSYDGLLIKC